MNVVLLGLATFYLWETVRYPFERFAPRVFDRTRVVHPLLVAFLPIVYLWPDWVAGLGVAGAVGLLVAVVDRVFGGSRPAPVVLPRRRSRGGLPDLP